MAENKRRYKPSDIFYVIGVALFLLGGFGAFRGWQTNKWPSADATIVANDIEVGRQMSQDVMVPSYSVKIKYRYVVEEKEYISSKLNSSVLGQFHHRFEWAKKKQDNYPRWQPVTAYYHPTRHHVSVLEPGVPIADRLILVFSILCLILGFILGNERRLRRGQKRNS